jgi:putative ABC transport system permease protein
VATLSIPVVLPPLGRLAGAPFVPVARLEERLARGALVRERSRTALTVGALMIGLALIVAIGGVALNARLAATVWLASVVPGDAVVTSIRPVGLDEPIVDDLRAVDGVQRVTPVATFAVAHRGIRLDAAAVAGADLLADGRLIADEGDLPAALAALDSGGSVILPRSLADRLGLVTGDAMDVAGVDGSSVELVVGAVVERTLPGRVGESVLVGWPDAQAAFGVVGADAFGVRYKPGRRAEAEATLTTVARAVALELSPIERVQGAVADALGRVFGLFDALALVAVIVAALGIANTLSMDVLERVREIGVLRATGMTRRQVARMVVVEAGVLGVVGSALGIVTGLLAGTFMVVLAGGGVPLAIPWTAMALAAALGIGVAMLAGYYPARIASRLPIVRAVQFD